MVLYSSIEKLHFFFFSFLVSTCEIFARNGLQRTWETHLFDISQLPCLSNGIVSALISMRTTDPLGEERERGTPIQHAFNLIGSVFNLYIIIVFSTDGQAEAMRKADLIVPSQSCMF